LKLEYPEKISIRDEYPVAFTPKGGCPLKPPRIGWVCKRLSVVAFTPKGGCPLKPRRATPKNARWSSKVAFTPKGGCPLKPPALHGRTRSGDEKCSIHPQGWVPIETLSQFCKRHMLHAFVAFTPKGGCPLKLW